jgi:thiamine biosynthesis lipoprotein
VVTAARALFEDEELRFSRFRPDSELSAVNGRGEAWTNVSPSFAELTALSLEGARESGGLFDPTMLGALEAAGYDRDYAVIRAEGAVSRPMPRRSRWTDVELIGRTLRLRHGARLDFGGVAKGWAVDRATRLAWSLEWWLISAGGDLRLTGRPPERGVPVDVEDPQDPGDSILTVRLLTGALATSSIRSRTWGEGLHQLIDPRTSRPAQTGVVQATVWAPTCAQAEIRATTAMLEGPSILDRFPGVLVLGDGQILVNLSAEVAA